MFQHYAAELNMPGKSEKNLQTVIVDENSE